MAGDQPMVNPAEIAAELLHYACRATSRGTDRGRAELLGARALEAQQAEIERLRTVLEVAANHMSMTGAPQTTIDAIRKAVRGG